MLDLTTIGGGYQGRRRTLSLALLIVVNLLPIYGVLSLNWDVGALVILYWSENLVIGFYTLVKMLVNSPIGGLFSGAFFCIHYGGFCAVHGLFILTLLIDPEAKVMGETTWPFVFVFVELLVDVVTQVLTYAPPAWIIVLAGLMLSHGVSFVVNFLLGGERYTANTGSLMSEPYGRIVVMHLAVIAGGMATMALGEPLAMLLVLVLLKLAVDIGLHIREHRKIAARQVPAAGIA